MMGLQHVGNWTMNPIHVDGQRILDLKSTWAWKALFGRDYATLADLDSTTPNGLVGH